MITHSELSDEDIESQLAGEAVRGPRQWRGRELAPLSRGLRALRNKVIAPEDTGEFHDVALLHILGQASSATDSGRFEKRRALIVATDDVTGFRTTVDLLLDDCSDAEIEQARGLVNEILGLVQKAEVTLAEKKTASVVPAAPSPTPMPLPSSTPSDSSTAPPNTPSGI
jgi:hypothetical protein